MVILYLFLLAGIIGLLLGTHSKAIEKNRSYSRVIYSIQDFLLQMVWRSRYLTPVFLLYIGGFYLTRQVNIELRNGQGLSISLYEYHKLLDPENSDRIDDLPNALHQSYSVFFLNISSRVYQVLSGVNILCIIVLVGGFLLGNFRTLQLDIQERQSLVTKAQVSGMLERLNQLEAQCKSDETLFQKSSDLKLAMNEFLKD